MTEKFIKKEKYDINDLNEIMHILRAPDGCPWDAEQTHKSIRKNFIEETYEVLEAIDNDDPELLKEELGDVLLQVVFHSNMEEEAGRFDLNDVADGICKKLIIRHPHVFGDVKVSGSDEVLSNWDDIKKQTKGQKTQTETMNSIPKVFPALMRAQKVQQKAKKVGFDWPDINGALDKLQEEIEELRQAIDKKDQDSCKDELGDVFFSAVNIARFLKLDAEEALTGSTDKFISRFSIVEKLAKESGKDMRDMSLEQLDELWDKAKKEK